MENRVCNGLFVPVLKVHMQLLFVYSINNIGPVLHHFCDIAGFFLRTAICPYFSLNLGMLP